MNVTCETITGTYKPAAKMPEIREGLECICKELACLEVTIEELRARVEPLRRATSPAATASTKTARSIGTPFGSELFDIEERINRLRERLVNDLELMEF